MASRKLLLVAEHLLFGDVLAAHIESAFNGADVQVAGNLPDAFEALAIGSFDLVLLDLALPGMHGLASLRIMQQRHPDTKVAVLSAGGAGPDVMDALRAGAMGVIPKSLRREALTNALRLMLGGEPYAPTGLLLSSAGAMGETAEEPVALRHLTARERQILRLLTTGRSNKEIARDLGVEVGTVAIHLNRAYRKLGVARRIQAVQMILAAGWIL